MVGTNICPLRLSPKTHSYGPIMERPASIIVDFKNKYDSNSVGFSEFGNIFNFGKAINTGEIVNPSTSLNRYQAIDIKNVV